MTDSETYMHLVEQFIADEMGKAEFKRMEALRAKQGKGIAAFLADVAAATPGVYWTLVEMKRTVGLTATQEQRLQSLARELSRDLSHDIATDKATEASGRLVARQRRQGVESLSMKAKDNKRTRS